MLSVLIGAVLNIVLDPLFIFVFHMGVRGAALATILSQAVSAAWVISFLLGKRTVIPVRKIMRCDSDSGKKLIKSMVLRTADRQGMC